MIRKYEESDLNLVLAVWYSASQVGHSFLSEAFFETERELMSTVFLPNAETWVFERDGPVLGFIRWVAMKLVAFSLMPPIMGRGLAVP